MASEQTVPVIAIDGPSASGKGTVAQAVAAALGFHYLNSGGLYRTVALAALEAGTDLENESILSDIALNLNAKFSGDSVELGGRDVTDALVGEAVSLAASRIAALPQVRAALLERQRTFRRAPGLVADGRDMGSVVFPDAGLKVFLTASPAERALRRHKQLKEKGLDVNLAALSAEIAERDRRDATRRVAPLVACADAVVLDTTSTDIDSVVNSVLALAQERLPGTGRKV